MLRPPTCETVTEEEEFRTKSALMAHAFSAGRKAWEEQKAKEAPSHLPLALKKRWLAGWESGRDGSLPKEGA